MSIRALIGFDHLEGLTNWSTYLDHGLAPYGASNIAVSGGYLGGSNAAQAQYGFQIPIAALIDPAATKYVVGMRIRVDNYSNPSTAISWLGPGFNGTGAISNFGGLFGILTTTGNIAYVEFEVDLVTGVVNRWVNNVDAGSITISLAVAKYFTFGGSWITYSAYRMAARDIYVLDNIATATDQHTTRLGPQVLVPIVGSAAVGPNWTTNAGTLLAALNPASGEQPNTNKATSPLTRDALTVTLSTNIPAGAVINGVEFNFGGKSLATGNTLVASKLVMGGSEKVGPTVSVPTAQSYTNPIGLFPKAPDGSDWTNAALNATKLVITPDVSG